MAVEDVMRVWEASNSRRMLFWRSKAPLRWKGRVGVENIVDEEEGLKDVCGSGVSAVERIFGGDTSLLGVDALEPPCRSLCVDGDPKDARLSTIPFSRVAWLSMLFDKGVEGDCEGLSSFCVSEGEMEMECGNIPIWVAMFRCAVGALPDIAEDGEAVAVGNGAKDTSCDCLSVLVLVVSVRRIGSTSSPTLASTGTKFDGDTAGKNSVSHGSTALSTGPCEEALREDNTPSALYCSTRTMNLDAS